MVRCLPILSNYELLSHIFVEYYNGRPAALQTGPIIYRIKA
ncbi:hypothetical protein KNP414_02553 [Paenibacillus mucilaginosus KNP414]|uniref:Uncharacterized protein n=1 Tax=Paenibacillus mucilaginosus (strain KNP414) TaxID=1036673 RepID=F8FAM5_PAEMK|nr:hypothetical protein KNP414_02553 [Paenibacillus mucilaginosus KNP414]